MPNCRAKENSESIGFVLNTLTLHLIYDGTTGKILCVFLPLIRPHVKYLLLNTSQASLKRMKSCLNIFKAFLSEDVIMNLIF